VSCAPERSGFPSRAGAAGSNHLPWALLRILQAIPKIKRARRGSGRPAVRGRGGVCSKDASDAFGPGKHGSAIAAADAERPRGDWSRWKAQERYRATPAAREKRNGQSGRYRERVKDRKTQQKEVVQEAARVITAEDFFRWLLRPAGMLRGLRAPGAKPAATVLLAPVSACDGARLGTGTAMA
jgi:hypothetical protein